MAVTVTLRTSADANNAIGFGSDGGLRTSLPPSRGGTQSYTLDNSWAAAGSPAFYYTLPTSSYVQYVLPMGTALVWPFMVARDARFSALGANVVTGASGSVYYHSAFSSDPSTGLPASKIADVASFSTASAAVVNATMNSSNATTVYTANTLYWMASWFTGTTAATLYYRNQASQSLYLQRLLTAPTATTHFTGSWGSLPETSSGWASRTSAPSTLSISASTVPVTHAPQFWVGLINV